jgi:hypothetical protein
MPTTSDPTTSPTISDPHVTVGVADHLGLADDLGPHNLAVCETYHLRPNRKNVGVANHL